MFVGWPNTNRGRPQTSLDYKLLWRSSTVVGRGLFMAALFKPKQYIFVYFRCPKCRMVSCMATANGWVDCGYKRCGRKTHMDRCEITEEEYNKMWG